MDKFEYKVRADEIKELIATGDYAQAADIADTIDWRRVKSVMMLCTISDLYKINRRYEDAKNMLLLAYERRPGGKTICYSLCELCIKTEEYVQAINYYKEFVQVAPKDPGRYILQYKLYEAQDVGLEERIGVLEELKKRDYREKWAYELAYLYHRVGLATRCVEECDELILWFGEGKYVIKAMELKMLHEPLTPGQQAKYDHRFAKGEIPEQTRPEGGDSYEEPQELWAETPSDAQPEQQRVVYPEVKQPETKEEPEEMDIQVKTMDVGEYNTINLQAELAAGLKEVLAADQKSREDAVTRSILSPMIDADTESLSLPEIDEVNEGDFGSEAEVMEGSEVFFGATGDLGNLQERSQEQPVEEEPNEAVPSAEETEATVQPTAEPNEAIVSAGEPEEPVPATEETDETAQTVMNELRMESEEQVLKAQPPKELAGVLSQESDGQIRLVVPESEAVEKQITGQMSIEDILTEWEKLKKVNEAKRQEEVRQHVLEQTGTMFTEFEAAVRDGLLEQLESQQAAAKDDEPDEPVEIAEAEAPEEVTEAEVVETDEPEAEEPEEVIEAETTAEPEVTEEVTEAEDVAETEESGEAQDAASEEYGEAEEIEEIEEVEEVEAAAEQENAEDQTESPAEPEEVVEADEPEATEEVTEAEIVAEEAEEAQAATGEEYGEVEEIEEIEETEAAEADEPVEREKPKVRALTREEKELYGPFIQSRSGKEKLVNAIDSISMAAYTGNIIITGEEGMDTLSLAKNMIREIQMTDSNFSGKVAKISGQGMNARNVEETLEHLKNGALIIQKASKMEKPAVEALCKTLQKENIGIIIALEDTKKAIGKLFKVYPELQESFTARMDVEAMSNDSLAAFGRQYAKKQEYSIDELGMLALHTCIEERQTIDHVVTVLDVKEIVDAAIHHANRKTLGHFFDILFAKRYDEEDMIILTEKDFV